MKTISQKLGIWPDDQLLVVNPDEKIIERIRNEMKDEVTFITEVPDGGNVPLVLIWLDEGDDPTAIANRYKQVIDETGQLWFFFPKKEYMRRQRLTITRETVTLDVLRAQLESTKICSIDADTQALGFVLPLEG
ncbi:MAG: hypothetical protein ACTSXZ_03840 [Alphaproteobacteria bacterium]